MTRRLRSLALLPRGPRARLLVGVATALVVALSAAQLLVVAVTALPADAAMRIGGVGGQVVAQDAVDARTRLYTALFGVTEPADPAGRDAFRRDTAKAYAVSEVVTAEAAARDIAVADRAVSDQLDGLVARSVPTGRDDFLARLAAAGVAERDVLAEVRRQMVTARLYEQVTRDVPPVTEDDVRRAYDERRATLVTPEQRRVRVIVLATAEDAAATLERLRGGADFAAEATRSLDRSTQGTGGDLGPVAREQLAALDPGLADAVFGAAPGAPVGPVPLAQGAVVAQVLEVRPGTPLGLEQARGELRAGLDVERRGVAWNGFVADRLRAADVEYADDRRPADEYSSTPPPAP